MPSGALTLIKRLQPYMRYPQFPETDPLAVLRRLSNADKHRTLHVMSGMLYHPMTVVTVSDYEPWIVESDRTGMDGAVVATLPWWPTEVEFQVEASGGIEVVLKEAELQGYWEVPLSLTNLLTQITEEVVTPLDVFL